LEKDRWVNLKNFRDPIVVFASQGDNITPPPQALNWIYKVYKSVDEIKRNGQVIVYIVHPKIGHLGIFVGSSVAKKEHTEIIGTIDMIEYLSPGLYEMVITDGEDEVASIGRNVEFIERDMEDILQLDDGLEDETAFDAVSAISRMNDKLYLTYASPLVRSMVSEPVAEMIRQMHPLRSQRYTFSDQNPLLWPCKYLAPWVKDNRKVVSDDNVFLQWERNFSDTVETSLKAYSDYRDKSMESMFKLMYENPWMKALFPEDKGTDGGERDKVDPLGEEAKEELWRKTMEKGSFEAAIIRIVLAVSAVDSSIDQREYLTAQLIFENNKRLNQLEKAELKRLVKEQAAIVERDKQKAINTLPKLLLRKSDRKEAFEIANSIANSDMKINQREQGLLDQIQTVLKL
jgi:tellurite resistance protein